MHIKATGRSTGPGAIALCLVEEASEREIAPVSHRPAEETLKTQLIVMFTLVKVGYDITKDKFYIINH